MGGNKDAYGELAERYGDMIYRFALLRIHDCDKAQDAAQEAFLIGYQNLMRLRKPSSFASWIAGITKNVCRNLAREASRNPVSLDYLAEIGIEPGEPGNQDSVDRERAALLHEIIGNLSPKYREIIDLRYTREFSYTKISNLLGISLTAVRSRLYHARLEIMKIAKKKELL
jgi:RNA polymerase sigma-70 factor (ECF subfamily)